MEMRSLRNMCEVFLKDTCRNSDVRERCGFKEDVVTRIEKSMFGHLERMNECRLTKQFYRANVGDGKVEPITVSGDTENYLAVTIGDEGNYIFIIRNDLPKAHTLTSRKFNYPLIVPDKWTRYDIFHNEHVLIVYRNDEAIMGWKPDVALVVYFFAMSCEKGWLLWTVNCAPPDIDSAPVDGGWSQWSEWHCSVTCGKGIGMRTRTCDNPKPNIFGKMCEGSALDTGPCSEFECGQISPETYDLIRWRLRHEYFSIRAAEGDEVSFVSPVDIIDRIRRESPLSDVRWTHKGTVLSMPTEKYSVVNDTITVKNVDQADGGTYLCLVYADDDTRTPLRAVVVAVEPSRTDKVLIEGSRMFLMCKTAPLPLVYTDLDIKLYLNNTLYSNTDVASPLTADGIRIRRVQFHHSGIWHCSVEQYDLGFRWVTAIYKVKVKERPSFLHHLMEDKLTRVIFGNMSSVNVIAVAIAIFVVFIIISVALGSQKVGSDGITTTYKALWKLDETKKLEVAFKTLQKEKANEHLKDFIELASKWACVQSSSIVRLYGITLSSPSAMVLEYLPYGPFDAYLRDNEEKVKPLHLKKVSTGLARALWDLSEAGIVHGYIRCCRLLLSSRDNDRITVKLSGPSLHTYGEQDVHWIPVEFFSDMSLARRSAAGDIWAFATTLWEIFSYGQSPAETNPVLMPEVKNDIYIYKQCWQADPHLRVRPQEIMRDLNHMLHREYVPIHEYEEPKIALEHVDNDETVSSGRFIPSEMSDAGSNKSLISMISSGVASTNGTVSSDQYDSSMGDNKSFNCLELPELPLLGVSGAHGAHLAHAPTVLTRTARWPGPASWRASSPRATPTSSRSPGLLEVTLLGLDPQQRIRVHKDDPTPFIVKIVCAMKKVMYAVILKSIGLVRVIKKAENCRSGLGNYGHVYKGWMERDNQESQDRKEIAAKKLSRKTNPALYEDFKNEMEIMKSLQHENVVEILGYSWEHGSDVLIVMEYLEQGSLYDYLKFQGDKVRKSHLIKYALDIAAVSEFLHLSRAETVERRLSERRLTERPLIRTVVRVGQHPLPRACLARASSAAVSAYLSRLVRLLLYSKGNDQAFTRLYSFKGMDYISAKNIVHRDLAARNILVVNMNHVKISDFGLARIIPKEENTYRIKTERLLPINWYAPESAVKPWHFSTKSDVWSYGVTAWEIFTRACVVVPKFDVKRPRERASEFTIPDECPSEIYRHLMKDCWELDPARRPKFIDLVHLCKRFYAEYK
ncbi:Macrophage colony-stimulating factor 1 receptor [Eumeta japonica]|uniref:Macrophage colony-stimulating factor 1 receptor n=1 Tax=Eumeta variegata TaxID=151549 RepID=A0A4C1T3F0_EUMVA|nr:Macrophage colony-stimulating factor 1 receptor [Eumeta japonica]